MLKAISQLLKFDVHLKEIIRGSSIAFVLKTLGAVFSFIFNVLLARYYGPDGSGLYFLALSVITIGTIFGRLGLDNVLLRLIASNAEVGDWTAVKGVYQKSMAISFLSSLSVSLIIIALTPWMAEHIFHKSELVPPMRWMALAILPLALLLLHSESLKGLKKIAGSITTQSVLVPAFSCLGIFFVGGLFEVKGVAWVYVVSACFAVLISFGLWKAATSKFRGIIVGGIDSRSILRISIPLFWVSLSNIVIMLSATIILGIFRSKTEVGLFAVSNRVAMTTLFILVSINSIAAPKFAALYKTTDTETMQYVAKKAAILMTLMASPFLLLFAFAPELVLRLFGEEFEQGGVLLIILSVGQFINTASGSGDYLLMMCGRETTMRNIFIFAAMLAVTLNFVLVPQFGALGSAIATASSLIVIKSLAVYFAWSRLGISVLPFSTGKPKRF